jgi:hypothetical protein
MGSDHHGEESDDPERLHDHGQNRNATTLMEVCGPTVYVLALIIVKQGFTYLDLQKIISTNALVVHLMVGIICITTAFIFDEGKSTSCVNDIRVDTNVDREILTGD